MINVTNLSLKYKDETALDDVSFNVNKGSLLCILGASGSGKTSLISLLCALQKPSIGNIMIGGNMLENVRQKTALISQNNGLLPWKTVYDAIAFTLKIRGEENVETRVNTVLEQLGLEPYRNRYPHQLSGGQQQRVAIGRALALNADILLMDEAFSALDSLTKETLQDQILSLNKNSNLTTVFVTHSIEEAVYLGSDIMVLKKGKISQYYENPAQGERTGILYYESCDKLRGYLHD